MKLPSEELSAAGLRRRFHIRRSVPAEAVKSIVEIERQAMLRLSKSPAARRSQTLGWVQRKRRELLFRFPSSRQSIDAAFDRLLVAVASSVDSLELVEDRLIRVLRSRVREPLRDSLFLMASELLARKGGSAELRRILGGMGRSVVRQFGVPAGIERYERNLHAAGLNSPRA